MRRLLCLLLFVSLALAKGDGSTDESVSSEEDSSLLKSSASESNSSGDGDDPTLVPTPVPPAPRNKAPKFVLTHPTIIQARQNFAFHLTLFKSSDYSLPVEFEATLKSGDRTLAIQKFRQSTNGVQKHEFTQLDLSKLLGQAEVYLSMSVKFLTKGLDAAEELASNPSVQKDRFVFIQSDKAIYKPTQEVKFVVMVLKSDLTPVVATPISIRILDTQSNVIDQVKNVKLSQFGVYERGFTLPALTNLGDWTIEVSSDDNTIPTSTQLFAVQYYVLPNIEVTFAAKQGFLVHSRTETGYEATVSAMYTFGKVAPGTAVVILKTTGYCNYEYDSKPDSQKLQYKLTIKGDGSASDGQLKLTGLNAVLTQAITDKTQCGLQFEVTFWEAATGRVYKMPDLVNVNFYPFSLTIQSHASNPQNFKVGLPLVFRYQLTKADGSPIDASLAGTKLSYEIYLWSETNPANYQIGCYGTTTRTAQTPRPSLKGTADVDGDGIATIEAGTADASILYITIKVAVRNNNLVKLCDDRYPSKTASGKTISVVIDRPVPSPLPKVGEQVTFKIQATFKAEYVYLYLAQNGQVVTLERLNRPTLRNSGTLATFTYAVNLPQVLAPRANVIVWTIEPTSSEILAAQLQFDIAGLVQQTVQANFSKGTVKPGEDVRLSVKTSEPNSLVVLVAVDKRVRLLKSGNLILLDAVLNAVAQGDSGPYFGRSSGRPAIGIAMDIAPMGMRIMSCWGGTRCFPWPGNDGDAYSVFMAARMMIYSNLPTSRFDGPVNDVPRPENAARAPLKSLGSEVRKNFPETWIWLTATSSRQKGTWRKTFKAPDTITTYELNAFAIGRNKGFGAAPFPVELKIFKDFFVNLDVKTPSIKRNEKVMVNILVSNYQSQAVTAVVELKSSDKFQVLIADEDGDESYQHADFVREVTVSSNKIATIAVWIRPVVVGRILFELSATSDDHDLQDAMETHVDCEAEGRIFYANRAMLIQLENDGNQVFTVDADDLFGAVNPDIVPQSKVFQCQAIGSPLGSALANLDRLITQPNGCGEQTLITLAPNIYIYVYLKAVGLLTTALEVEIRKNADYGYRNQLTYQRKDFGFSAFGSSDPESSTWLTAFTFQVFTAALKQLETAVDLTVLDNAFNFIESQYDPSTGSYKEPGKVIHTDMIGTSGAGAINRAAYIYLTYGEAGRKAKALTQQLLRNRATDSSNNDAQQLALLAYAFSLEMFPEDAATSKTALDKLLTLATQTGGTIFWKPADIATVTDSYQRLGRSAIETAGYALLALLKAKRLTEAFSVARWLMSQRNQFGGFESTQDTVVGLKALAAISQQWTARGQSLQIDCVANYDDGDDAASTTFNIDKNNAVVFQSFVFPREREDLQTVDIRAKGVGVALVQVAARYNLFKYDTGHFSAITTLETATGLQSITVKTCLKLKTVCNEGMILFELGIPTGYGPDLSRTVSLNSLSEGKLIEGLSHVEVQDGKFFFYFYNLPSGSTSSLCVRSVIVRLFEVEDVDQPLATVSSYYSPLKCFLSQQYGIAGLTVAESSRKYY